MNGKDKCRILKNIRRDIAKANNIPLDIPECTHKGDCLGTCPRCESEVRYLEHSLAERRARGFKIALAGISAGLIAVNTTSCDVINDLGNFIYGQQLAGDMIAETEMSDGIIEPPGTNESVDTEISYPGEVTEIATLEGDIAEEEYVLGGDIAVFPQEDIGLIKGILLAPEDETTFAQTQESCPDGVHEPGIIPKSGDASDGTEE